MKRVFRMYGTIHAMQSSPQTTLAWEKFPHKLRHVLDTSSKNSVSQNTMSLRLGDLIKSPSIERSLSIRATRPDAEILIRATWYETCHVTRPKSHSYFSISAYYHALDRLHIAGFFRRLLSLLCTHTPLDSPHIKAHQGYLLMYMRSRH